MLRLVSKSVVARCVGRKEFVRSFRSCAVVAAEDSPYAHGKFRSNAQALVNEIPVIEVAGHVAVCDGGSGALGHPVEYIQLDTVSKKPAVCKYCGLRFKMSSEPHHH